MFRPIANMTNSTSRRAEILLLAISHMHFILLYAEEVQTSSGRSEKPYSKTAPCLGWPNGKGLPGLLGGCWGVVVDNRCRQWLPPRPRFDQSNPICDGPCTHFLLLSHSVFCQVDLCIYKHLSALKYSPCRVPWRQRKRGKTKRERMRAQAQTDDRGGYRNWGPAHCAGVKVRMPVDTN